MTSGSSHTDSTKNTCQKDGNSESTLNIPETDNQFFYNNKFYIAINLDKNLHKYRVISINKKHDT